MKYGIDLPNMGAASDPRLLATIAREAEDVAEIAGYARRGRDVVGRGDLVYLPPHDAGRMRKRILGGPPR